jgi:hypothetical protein
MNPNAGQGSAWKGGVTVNDADTGRIVPTMNLTEMQAKFVEAYVENGGNGTQAAITAGYSQDCARVQAQQNLERPKIRLAVEQLRDQKIKTDGATRAWQTMYNMLNDPSAPAQARFQAARWVLEASGHGLSAVAAGLQLGLQKSKKDLSQMSIHELEELIRNGQASFESIKTTVKTVVKGHEKSLEIDGRPVIDVPPSQHE